MMPKISEFFGIAIYVYYRDHAPPHFHAIHGNEEVWIGINDLAIIKGGLSPRAAGLVFEWASQHQAELVEVWALARDHKPLRPIEPLR